MDRVGGGGDMSELGCKGGTGNKSELGNTKELHNTTNTNELTNMIKSTAPDQQHSIKELADSEVEDADEEIEKMKIVSGKLFPPLSLEKWVKGYETIGFQGTHLYEAVEELRRMKTNGSKIFLGFTSNLVSSGLRDLLCALVRHKCVGVVVTTAGAVEEDIIKTLKPSRLGSFGMDGGLLRSRGMNRIGNVIVPNENYFEFEEWLTRVLDRIVDGEVDGGGGSGEGSENRAKDNAQRKTEREIGGYRRCGGLAVITPSRLIYELGREAQCEESIWHWAYANSLPVYCPAITDGSIGDIITYYKRRKELVIDLVEDIAKINREGVFEERTGALILGAGVVKHHILNANLFRNGLDHCVLVNTAQEYDGSDAGARVDEAVSWGKIKKNTTSVKVHADASIVFPIIAAAVWPEIFAEYTG